MYAVKLPEQREAMADVVIRPVTELVGEEESRCHEELRHRLGHWNRPALAQARYEKMIHKRADGRRGKNSDTNQGPEHQGIHRRHGDIGPPASAPHKCLRKESPQ